MTRSVDPLLLLLIPSPDGLSEIGGREVASVDFPPALPGEEIPMDLLDVLLVDGIPCMASLNASISEGLCSNTENPCFCRKKMVFGISALNRTALSHWPLFSINS